MHIIADMERWGNSHRPGFLDLFRIILGLFITYKGLFFVTHINTLEITAFGLNEHFAGMSIAHYVAFAHILGGPMILLGVYTRFACVIQLPILIGAVFLVNAPKGFLSLGQHMELWLSIIVLAGLITFVVFGAGKFSVDAIRRRDAEAHLGHL
jgi:putative oxidoreductase